MTSLSKVFIAQTSTDCGPRSARRIGIHPDHLKTTKTCAGDVLALYLEDSKSPTKPFVLGIAWPSAEVPPNVVSVSSSHLLAIHASAGDNVRLACLSGAGATKPPSGITPLKDAREATSVKIIDISDQGASSSLEPFTKVKKEKTKNWLELLVRELLVDLKYITTRQIIAVHYEGKYHRFRIAAASAEGIVNEPLDALATELHGLSLGPPKVWVVGWDTNVSIDESVTKEADKMLIHASSQEKGLQAYGAVGGLSKQIEQIRDLLEIPLTRPELFEHFGIKPPRGILLYGPPGTGKTHLARAIAASTNASVLIINGPELSSAFHGETESKLRDVFKEARSKSPCIVVLDEIDALAPRREDSAGGEVEKRVVATLLTILDGMESSDSAPAARVVVVGTTNRPNAIDPALRRPGRFDREIEIGVPDADARLSIIQVLLAKVPHELSTEDLRTLVSRAHGYVGADLSAVVREAGTLAIKRWMESHPQQPIPTDLRLTLPDLAASLPTVRPSAMRSLFIEAPPVRYAEIGGQEENIQRLQEAVEWPLLHPEAFKRLGVRPPKGVLLYGPPGCSKTILARACACESGVNFVAVKGPELLNKYVGESERAVREIFRKARAASPSIIFFDEIDAIATSRSSSDEGPTSSHEGVLTSLLNEMDGVQELLGVTIIAATNRPDAVDTALMRPGRLDRLLFVGPPNQGGREEILRIQMGRMSIDEDVSISEIATLAEGCSGAEVVALCQEAAMLTMRKDMNASFVPHEAFVSAAKTLKRQITPAILASFTEWGEKRRDS